MKLKYLKSVIVLLLILLFSIFLTSCGGVDLESAIPVNSEGDAAEYFVPMNSNFVFALNGDDEVQRTRFEAIVERFSFDFLEGFNSQVEILALEQYGLDFENDIKPVLGDNYRILVSTSLDFNGEFADETQDKTVQLYGSGDAETFIVITVEDEKGAEELISKVAEMEGWLRGFTEGYVTLANATSGMHIMLAEGFIIITNTDDGLEHAIARYHGELPTLVDNEDYLSAINYFDKPPFGYVYLDLEDVGLQQSGLVGLSPHLGVALYQIHGIHVTEDGFEFNSLTKFDKDELKNSGVTLKEFNGGGSYQDKLINSDNLAFYSESYNVAKALELSTLVSMDTLSAKFQAFFGSSIEDGLLSWMDKGFSIAVYDSQWVIPDFTFAFDASSNLKAAKEFYLRLDTQLSGLIAMFQSQEGVEASKTNYDDLSVVKIDLSEMIAALAATNPYATSLQIEGLEISYGLTEDDLFVISTQKGFKDLYGENVVADDVRYKAARKLVGKANAGGTYINMDSVITYITNITDEIILLTKKREESIKVSEIVDGVEVELPSRAEELEQTIANILEALSQIDFVVIDNDIQKDDEIISKGYFKLK